MPQLEQRHRRVARIVVLLPLLLLIAQGRALAQHAGIGLSPSAGFDVGPNYHSLSADFENGGFISRYHDPAVRATVVEQLQTMANAGASMVKTTLWQVGDSSQAWRLSFPYAAQELANIATYAQDVGQTRGQDGRYLTLTLSMAWLGCADYNVGSAASTIGHCNYSWATFLDYARTSITTLVQRIGSIYRPDGQLAVSTLHLELEVMIGARPNQDQFLIDLYPYFLNQTSATGVNGSLYFTIVPAEADVFEDDYRDDTYAVLNGHKSLYWLYRSVQFMVNRGLPVPQRLDLSFYPERQTRSYAQLIERVFDDFDAVFPGHSAAIVETPYPLDAFSRQELGQAFGAAYLARGLPEQVNFWTTPYQAGNAGPPFDVQAFALRVPAGASSRLTAPPCALASGQQSCNTTVDWNTTAAAGTAALWMKSGTTQALVACGKTGSVNVSVVADTVYTFELRAAPACDRSASVATGVSLTSTTLTASSSTPAPVPPPAPEPGPSQSRISASACSGTAVPCTTTVSWTAVVASGIAAVFVQRGTGPLQLFACQTAGQQEAAWVEANTSYTFAVYGVSRCSADMPQTAPLATTTVTGPSLSAPPSPPAPAPTPGDSANILASVNECDITVLDTLCATTIFWTSASSAKTAQVFVQQGSASPVLFACGASGSQLASWIGLNTSYTFTVYAASSCDQTSPQGAALANVTVSARLR